MNYHGLIEAWKAIVKLMVNKFNRENEKSNETNFLVKELCQEIVKYKPLKALRLEGNTINEEAATAIGKALEKHSEIEVDQKIFSLKKN